MGSQSCRELDDQERQRRLELLLKGGIPGGKLDEAVKAVWRRVAHIDWKMLPEKVILVRHGESEGNVDHLIYANKGDAMLELTPRGLQQARQAGARIKEIVKDDKSIYIAVSPFERTQQTLLGLYQGGLPVNPGNTVKSNPQIREQEFGNFQHVGSQEKASAEQALVGRFYYRRDNGESSADVYDRVSSFWEDLLLEHLPFREQKFDSCLIVTHGLTMRLLLMKVFGWSIDTFETVFNMDNCEHLTLVQDLEKREYVFSPELSQKGRWPWATRKIWVVMKEKKSSKETHEKEQGLLSFRSSPALHVVLGAGQSAGVIADMEEGQNVFEVDGLIDKVRNKALLERSEVYTVMDYLTVPQRRTDQREKLNGRLLPGHERCKQADLSRGVSLDWSKVEFVDWWGPARSFQAKMLRKEQQERRMPAGFVRQNS